MGIWGLKFAWILYSDIYNYSDDMEKNYMIWLFDWYFKKHDIFDYCKSSIDGQNCALYQIQAFWFSIGSHRSVLECYSDMLLLRFLFLSLGV